MGANIFKDRGAIERADFAGPTAMVVDPLDNATARDPLNPKVDGSYDYDSSVHNVVVINQKTTDFAIQLSDSGGIGIDDSSILVDPTAADPVVKTGLVTVYRAPSLDVFSAVAESDWPTLRLGTDYLLDYDTVNNILHVIPATGVWESGAYYVIDVDNTMVQDLAGNVLQPNRSTAPFTGKTLFTIQLTGLDFGDLPDDPDNLVDPDYVTLLGSGPADGQGGARHVVTGGVYLGSPPDVEDDANTTAAATDPLYESNGDFRYAANGDLFDDGVIITSALLLDSQGVLTITASTEGYLNVWIDFNGDGRRSRERADCPGHAPVGG